ncbi:MAG: hypothetical protein HYY18_14375 [Planctomycetes bacterium]|nr:hypothetical protein [Planctomycetota bacterium]
MSKPHSHDQHGSPEEDAALARELLAEGDLPHAMFHLAGALASDPANVEWLKLFDEIAGASPDPPSLIPDSGEGFWHGLAACRSRLLYRSGRRHDAMSLMFQVIAAFPAQDYHVWAEEWAKAPGQLLDARPVFTFFGGLSQRYSGGVATADERAELERLLPLVDLLCEKLPNDVLLQAHRGTLHRKAGHLGEGVEITGRAYRQGPSWQTAVLAAGSAKANGDRVAARAYFEKALGHDPMNLSAHLDLGDMAAEEGDFAEAQKRYGKVLAREPHHPWAEPSAAYIRWATDRDATSLGRLRELASQPGPAMDRAVALMANVRNRTVFERFFFPQEATFNSLMQLVDSYQKQEKPIPRGMVLNIGVTACEPPSVRLAVRRTLPDCKLNMSISSVQSPDPRLPSGDVDFLLWKFEGTDPSPAVPEVEGPARSGLVRIAASEFGVGDWKRYSRSLVAEMRPSDPVPGVLGSMVHPPGVPEGCTHPEWMWILRVQLAGAFVLAALDDGWKASRRRSALLSLARGPLDWTVTAAVVALTEVALDCPESREEIRAEFVRMIERPPEPGWTCWIPALIEGALEIPGLSPEERSRHLEVQRQLAAADLDLNNPEYRRKLKEAATQRPAKQGCFGVLLALLAP